MSRRISAAPNSEGFTFIESLMALAILGVIVGVLVRVHLQALRAGEFSRLQGRAILESETILTGSLLGSDPKSLMDDAGKLGMKVDAVRVGDSGTPPFMEWRVAVSNPGAPVVVMLLRSQAETGDVKEAGSKTHLPR